MHRWGGEVIAIFRIMEFCCLWSSFSCCVELPFCFFSFSVLSKDYPHSLHPFFAKMAHQGSDFFSFFSFFFLSEDRG